MGVQIRDIVARKKTRLQYLSGKSVAIDAHNTLYQFLSIIRSFDGRPLMDGAGHVTSHLSGLLYRTMNFIKLGIKPVYVFDGKPPVLKKREIARRINVKKKAEKKYQKALSEGRLEDARMYSQATARLTNFMVEDSKRLLILMGIPWIQAPSEGEAQAAYLTTKGDANYCGSQDYDSLLFGATVLVRNVTMSGRRKIPRKNVYVEVVPEIMKLDYVLEELEITREQLVDVAILVGTDFNPEGVKGVGPKTALKLIKKYGSIEEAMPSLQDAEFPVEPKRIREIFLNPKVTDNYNLEWKAPNIDGVVDFLCREKDFSEERVRKTLKRMIEGIKEAKSKTTLETWFG
ncbi:flap endonuclease-1 [Candidatus Bathyarchaeota archaeon]|nr:flap endonuclease-1 [Candidatus Bathyarchaeota archaeon]